MDANAPADPVGLGPQGDLEALDRMLARDRVLIVAGPGGVGKTTLAAALGLRAARHHGRRVVVVTVDPARRLAEALGVARLTEEAVLVPVGGEGRMWAVMVDMARSWDRLVEANGPDRGTIERLLDNGLYRSLTRRFIQSHDYIALDHVLSLDDGGRYDLIVVDTPPSAHAIDLLDAPGRMIDFFDSRLLRWLTIGGGSGLAGAAARPFLLLAERLLGRLFLGQIVEFFTLFARLRPALVRRARAVEDRLDASDTSYVVVTSTEPPVVESCQVLIDRLRQRDRDPELLLVNRLAPTLRLEAGDRPTLVAAVPAGPVDGAIEDPSLVAAVTILLDRAAAARLPELARSIPVVAVPLTAGDLTELDDLDALLGGP
jgi:anion-transporting  ArsA/GET3 family ATPase